MTDGTGLSARMLSVDPGLDAIAIAVWDLEQRMAAGALRSIIRLTSTETLALPDRLKEIGSSFGQIVLGPGANGIQDRTVVVVELPGTHVMYGRYTNPGQIKGVLSAMIESSYATGVLLLVGRHAAHVLAVPADTTKKESKQQTAGLFLKDWGFLGPKPPRRVWSGDELDAVFVGLRHFQRARLALLSSAPPPALSAALDPP